MKYQYFRNNSITLDILTIKRRKISIQCCTTIGKISTPNVGAIFYANIDQNNPIKAILVQYYFATRNLLLYIIIINNNICVLRNHHLKAYFRDEKFLVSVSMCVCMCACSAIAVAKSIQLDY